MGRKPKRRLDDADNTEVNITVDSVINMAKSTGTVTCYEKAYRRFLSWLQVQREDWAQHYLGDNENIWQRVALPLPDELMMTFLLEGGYTTNTNGQRVPKSKSAVGQPRAMFKHLYKKQEVIMSATYEIKAKDFCRGNF
jgi:hypothetical protein